MANLSLFYHHFPGIYHLAAVQSSDNRQTISENRQIGLRPAASLPQNPQPIYYRQTGICYLRSQVHQPGANNRQQIVNRFALIVNPSTPEQAFPLTIFRQSIDRQLGPHSQINERGAVNPQFIRNRLRTYPRSQPSQLGSRNRQRIVNRFPLIVNISAPEPAISSTIYRESNGNCRESTDPVPIAESTDNRPTLRGNRPVLTGDIQHLGRAWVLPHPERSSPNIAPMVADPEIERIAVQVAIKHEEAQGRLVESVEKDNRGFDLISRKPHPEDPKTAIDVRLIEVKGRADTGEIALTANEYNTAKRLKRDYYLYVVFHCATFPSLNVFQDPATLDWQPIVKIEQYRLKRESIRHPVELKEDPTPYRTGGNQCSS